MKILLTAAATVALLTALAAPALAERPDYMTQMQLPNADDDSGGSSSNSIGSVQRVQPTPSINQVQPLAGTGNSQLYPKDNYYTAGKPDPNYVKPGAPQMFDREPTVMQMNPNPQDGSGVTEPPLSYQDRYGNNYRRPVRNSPAADSAGLPNNVRVIGRHQRAPVTLDIQSGTVTQQQPPQEASQAQQDAELQRQADIINMQNRREMQRVQGVIQQMQGGGGGGGNAFAPSSEQGLFRQK